jgi:hypothetical protein
VLYLIWSFEHRAWWGPDECGYTEDLAQAGRYSADDAGRIVTGSIWLDEVAILEKALAWWCDKPPIFHPYKGEVVERRSR